MWSTQKYKNQHFITTYDLSLLFFSIPFSLSTVTENKNLLTIFQRVQNFSIITHIKKNCNTPIIQMSPPSSFSKSFTSSFWTSAPQGKDSTLKIWVKRKIIEKCSLGIFFLHFLLKFLRKFREKKRSLTSHKNLTQFFQV